MLRGGAQLVSGVLADQMAVTGAGATANTHSAEDDRRAAVNLTQTATADSYVRA